MGVVTEALIAAKECLAHVCTGNDLRCLDGNGCECEMAGNAPTDPTIALHNLVAAMLKTAPTPQGDASPEVRGGGEAGALPKKWRSEARELESVGGDNALAKAYAMRLDADELEAVMSVQPRPDETFADWLATEMPAGTIIGDPAWWADRIARQYAVRSTQPASDPVGVEREVSAFNDWFESEQGKPYDGGWEFGKAAWLHRAYIAQQPAAPNISSEHSAALSAQPRPDKVADQPPKGWSPCSRCNRPEPSGPRKDCYRCGGSGWRKKCNALDCLEYGCSGYGFCIVNKEEVSAALSAQPRQEVVAAWPAPVRDEALEVLRNVDTQLSATGQASARIERLINVLAGMKTTAPRPASAPVGVEELVREMEVFARKWGTCSMTELEWFTRRLRAALAQQPAAHDASTALRSIYDLLGVNTESDAGAEVARLHIIEAKSTQPASVDGAFRVRHELCDCPNGRAEHSSSCAALAQPQGEG